LSTGAADNVNRILGSETEQGAPVISYNVIRGSTACCAGGGIALGYNTGATVISECTHAAAEPGE